MDLIKRRERNKRRQFRKEKRHFLKELKNSYINNEDYFLIVKDESCYTIFERVDLAKEFLDNNKIVYKITPSPEEAIGFIIPVSSFKIIFNKSMINMFNGCKLTSIPALDVKDLIKESEDTLK